jgi:hypothetical protein
MSNNPALINFEFENFSAVLSSSISHGKRIESSTSGVNVGYRKITLKLYNGGEDGLKICLENMGSDYRFYATLRNSNGGAVCECSFDYKMDGLLPIKLSTVLDKEQNILVNNALWIDVLLQKKIPRSTRNLVPKQNDLGSKILGLLKSGVMSDITFRVQNKRIKAHSFILKLNAPLLAEFCQHQVGNVDVEGAPLIINDTTPEVFKIALRKVYGDSISVMKSW